MTMTIDETGAGRPALILHGGGGPMTVAPIAQHLSATMHALLPTHPGWNGTPRPASVATVDDIAALYGHLLDERDLTDVVVIGSSLGGWIGAALAASDPAGRIARLVLIDAVGIDVPGEPITDFFALDPRGVVEHSFHDPDRFYVDPATVPAEQAAVQRANIETMRIVAGDPYMHDPALRDRLGSIAVPTLAVWGVSDRIVTPAYGRAYAEAIPGARFELIPEAGHLPQLEQPQALFATLDAFAGA